MDERTTLESSPPPMRFLRNIDEGGTDKALTRDGETQKAIECEISLHSYFIPFHSPELSILTILVKDIRHEGHKRQRVKEVLAVKAPSRKAFLEGLGSGRFPGHALAWKGMSMYSSEFKPKALQTLERCG